MKAALQAQGVVMGIDPTPSTIAAAEATRKMTANSQLWMTVVALLLAAGRPRLRVEPDQARFPRPQRDRAVFDGAADPVSLIAVLTTVGIVLSLLSETVHFFQLYPASEFFFSADLEPEVRRRVGSGHLAAGLGHDVCLGHRAWWSRCRSA